jgi:hypothetical protein
MTADITAPPVMEYGVQFWSKTTCLHEVSPAVDLTAALADLSDTRQHRDASAALMWRSDPGEGWCPVGPDEGIDAFEAHLAKQRQAVRHA